MLCYSEPEPEPEPEPTKPVERVEPAKPIESVKPTESPVEVTMIAISVSLNLPNFAYITVYFEAKSTFFCFEEPVYRTT